MPVIVRAAGPDVVMVVRVTRGGAAARHGAHSQQRDDADGERATTPTAARADHAEPRRSVRVAPAARRRPTVRQRFVDLQPRVAPNRGVACDPSRDSGAAGGESRRASRRASAVQSGSVFSTDASVSEIVSPSNSALARSASRTARTPNAQMSRALVDRSSRAPAPGSCTPPCRGSSRACRHRGRGDRRRHR